MVQSNCFRRFEFCQIKIFVLDSSGDTLLCSLFRKNEIPIMICFLVSDMWSWLPLLGYDINGMAPTVGCNGELLPAGMKSNYMHDWRNTYKEHQVRHIYHSLIKLKYCK